jgi:hypothetical protein
MYTLVHRFYAGKLYQIIVIGLLQIGMDSQTNACVHTYIHTYIHTYMYTLVHRFYAGKLYQIIIIGLLQIGMDIAFVYTFVSKTSFHERRGKKYAE